jgi:hypothetical protein
VLDDDEGHAIVRRKSVQELPASVKAASRSADCDDRKIRAPAGREWPLKPTRSIRLSMMRMTSRHSVSFLEERRSRRANYSSIAEFGRDYDLLIVVNSATSLNASTTHDQLSYLPSPRTFIHIGPPRRPGRKLRETCGGMAFAQ